MKISLNSILSGFNLTKLNENFQKIQDELNNKVLYRDNPSGEPNVLQTDIDLNGRSLYNLPAPVLPSQAARLQDIIDSVAGNNTANLITYQSPGGSRTVSSKLGEHLSVKDFGAVGDGVADDTAAIQATIDYAIYTASPAIGTVYFPSGSYKTTNTIHCGYGVSGFRSIVLEGAGSSYNGESAFGGTRILPTFSDRPAINFQGVRRGRIRRMTVIGLNNAFIAAQGFGGLAPVGDDTDSTVWVAPTLHANANTRYAPYAGISVDAYAGAAPATSYPAVTYPAFLGAVSQYNKNFSSNVVIEDCYIAGFVVDVVVQPSDADGNGDYVSLHNTVLQNAVYGVSVGNGQSRNVNLYNCQIGNVHTPLTNNKHGKQRGKFGGVISGCEIGTCIQIFDINTGFSGPMMFDGCYGELVWRLGNTNLTAAGSVPILINSSEFSFNTHPAIRGVPKLLVEGGSNVIRTIGGAWAIPSIGVFAGAMATQGTLITSADMAGATSSRNLAQRVSGGLLPIGSQIIQDESSELRTNATTGQLSLAKNSPGGGRTKTLGRLIQTVQWRESSANLPPVPCSRLVQSANRASSPLTISGISGTIDFTATPQLYGTARAGDLIQDDQTGTVFLVTSNAGLVASVTALNNYYNPGTGNVLRTAIPGTGNWYLLSARYYTTSYPLFGDVTSGSPIITNCNRGDGYGGFIGTDLAVGDFLLQGTWTSGVFGSGATITAIDASAKTITMSSNANTTSTKQPFHFWVQG